ncbi:DinB family protein [Salipaludibacillus sp. HK11]|uniref:DinB family protein n=1 Tax=Salipaludibacillus sp. HK11 TaxID=3394320 RepID=UPI0039FDB886
MLNSNGFKYTATMTNALALEIPKNCWDTVLIPELGTLRKLFIHIVRLRDVYRDGLITGEVEFPGLLPSKDNRLVDELERSMNELASAFTQSKFNQIKMGNQYLTIIELLNTAVQHEGIHQGQYYVALKQAGIDLPKQWIQDWNM